MTTTTDVLISGAGPTGLFLALWLTRLGVRVRVADLKSGPVQETRAIAVQARTLEYYDQLGLGADAMRRGRHFDRLNLFVRGDLRGAVRLRGVGDDLTPHPYLYILTQDQNEELLVEHLTALGVSIDWNTEVTAFTQDDAGVTATFSRNDQHEIVRASYAAGCDGARSAVRHALGVPLSGGTYAQRFYVADITLRGKVREGDVNLSLDDDHFLAFFPMPEPHRHRVVGQLGPGVREHATFEDVRPELEANGLAQVSTVHWFSTYRVHHRVADHFRVHRAFILGDAAHVHTPVGGQGMNTGLGDAANLAWKLAQAVHGGGDEVLDTYEPERRPFAVALVNTTDRVFTGIVRDGAAARFLRLTAVPTLLPLLTRAEAVRRLLFLTVSQTRLHYPDSSLSQGAAGGVHGGERLPWVALPQGGSNFDALRSLTWQAHTYGPPAPDLLAWCARREVPLHVFPETRASRHAGLTPAAVYLVRPDGYVGLACATFDAAALDAYTDRWVRPATPRPHLPPRPSDLEVTV
ncbi:FAD-dependent monooxygenase [Deinococcus pimensis]|uniref:FAD-dependent monooxygenase n=1 Tax=Deinococcus pimensis TaxID=309888 RepID=UPI0004B20341|nr:FAD-dependent monooxygenase [Deinococcus pimensis]